MIGILTSLYDNCKYFVLFSGKKREGWPEDEKERDRPTKVAANIMGHGAVTQKVLLCSVFVTIHLLLLL
jgi:hypothetical protein